MLTNLFLRVTLPTTMNEKPPNAIRAWAEAVGLTPTKLARLIDRKLPTVQSWFYGKKHPATPADWAMLYVVSGGAVSPNDVILTEDVLREAYSRYTPVKKGKHTNGPTPR